MDSYSQKKSINYLVKGEITNRKKPHNSNKKPAWAIVFNEITVSPFMQLTKKEKEERRLWFNWKFLMVWRSHHKQLTSKIQVRSITVKSISIYWFSKAFNEIICWLPFSSYALILYWDLHGRRLYNNRCLQFQPCTNVPVHT